MASTKKTNGTHNGKAYEFVDHYHDVVVVGAGGAVIRSQHKVVSQLPLAIWDLTVGSGTYMTR